MDVNTELLLLLTLFCIYTLVLCSFMHVFLFNLLQKCQKIVWVKFESHIVFNYPSEFRFSDYS